MTVDDSVSGVSASNHPTAHANHAKLRLCPYDNYAISGMAVQSQDWNAIQGFWECATQFWDCTNSPIARNKLYTSACSAMKIQVCPASVHLEPSAHPTILTALWCFKVLSVTIHMQYSTHNFYWLTIHIDSQFILPLSLQTAAMTSFWWGSGPTTFDSKTWTHQS